MAQIIPLSSLEAASNAGFTHKIVLLYSDAAAFTCAAENNIYPTVGGTATFAAGLYVTDAVMRVVTAFTATVPANLTTLTFSVGDGSSATSYVAATSVLSTTYAGYNSTKPAVYTAADTISVTPVLNTNATGLISATATLNAGEVHIYLALAELAKLDK